MELFENFQDLDIIDEKETERNEEALEKRPTCMECLR